MKINEIITENKGDSVPAHAPKNISDSSKGALVFRDGGYDRTHHLYRVMNAVAMADGKSDSPVDMEANSWHSKYNTAIPYSEEEHNMVKSALKTVGAEYHEPITDHRSHESDQVHKQSPVQDRGPIQFKPKKSNK